MSKARNLVYLSVSVSPSLKDSQPMSPDTQPIDPHNQNPIEDLVESCGQGVSVATGNIGIIDATSMSSTTESGLQSPHRHHRRDKWRRQSFIASWHEWESEVDESIWPYARRSVFESGLVWMVPIVVKFQCDEYLVLMKIYG